MNGQAEVPKRAQEVIAGLELRHCKVLDPSDPYKLVDRWWQARDPKTGVTARGTTMTSALLAFWDGDYE